MQTHAEVAGREGKAVASGHRAVRHPLRPQMPEPPARRPTPTHQFLVLSLPTLVLPQHWPGPGFRGKARRAVAGWGGWRGGPGQGLTSTPSPPPSLPNTQQPLFYSGCMQQEERRGA